MKPLALAALLLVACVDGNPHAGSEIVTAPRAPVPDLAPAPQPDLARPVEVPDMTVAPAVDIAPPAPDLAHCGALGEPCCEYGLLCSTTPPLRCWGIYDGGARNACLP